MEWVTKLMPDGGAWSETVLASRALAAPELLARAVETVGLGATSWGVEVAERALDRVRQHELTGGFSTATSGRARQASESAFLSLLIGIGSESEQEATEELAPDLLEVVRSCVRQALPVDVLLNRIWAIHTVTRDEVFTALQRIVPVEAQPETLRAVSTAMFDYANVHAHRVSTAYWEEHKAWRGRRTEEQHRIVAAVVDGSAPPDRASLDVHWEGGHAYALGWVEEQSWVPDFDAGLSEYANRVAGALGAEKVVVLERDNAIQLWWNAPGPLLADAETVLVRLPRPAWLRFALGPVSTGVDGFRDAVRGARVSARAARLPEAADRGTWLFSEMGHVALMAENREAAAWFVRRELGPLLAAGPRMAEIRDTVRLYLATGNSRVSVAKELHVAPNTVAYRVGQANEILGRPVGDRSQQVLLALQVVHVLPGLLD